MSNFGSSRTWPSDNKRAKAPVHCHAGVISLPFAVWNALPTALPNGGCGTSASSTSPNRKLARRSLCKVGALVRNFFRNVVLLSHRSSLCGAGLLMACPKQIQRRALYIGSRYGNTNSKKIQRLLGD
jgi:hypothetical protein